MLSTTNPVTMWSEFRTERAATLAQLPPAVDPSLLVQYEQQAVAALSATQSASGFNPSATAGSSSSSTQSDHELANVEGAVSTDPFSSEGSDSWGKKYGVIALALLGANLLIGVVLLGVTVTLCVRGMKGQNASPRYKHLRLPKVAEDDYERGAMGRYSD